MSVVVGRARVTAQGATVGGTAHVYADGSDAVLYTDASGSTAAGNTVTVASDSTVSFYAVPGVYAVRVPVGGGRLTNTVQATVTLPVPSAVSVLDVSKWPPADDDVFTFDAASGMFVPDAPAAGSDLPTPGSGDAGKVLTVNEGEDGYELDAPSGASEGSHVAVPFNFATAEATLVAGHDAVFHINITGAPTGGTFQTAYNGSPLGDPLAFDCSVSDIQAVFDGGVGSGYVIGGANPNFTLDNTVSQDSPLADLLTFDVSGLTGGSSPDVTCTLITPFVHQVIGMIVYAPTVGEWLYDMWFELIDTFDGVNPNLDVCSAASLDEGSPTGLFDLNNRGAIDGTDAPDDTSQFNGGLANATNTFGPSYLRADGVLPARFVDSGPLYLACSDSGTPYGINPESTVGSGVLHLIVYPAAS